MQIKVNGDNYECTIGCSLEQLLKDLGVNASSVLLEYNGEVLIEGDLVVTQLCEGDVVEIIEFVAGG